MFRNNRFFAISSMISKSLLNCPLPTSTLCVPSLRHQKKKTTASLGSVSTFLQERRVLNSPFNSRHGIHLLLFRCYFSGSRALIYYIVPRVHHAQDSLFFHSNRPKVRSGFILAWSVVRDVLSSRTIEFIVQSSYYL
jgi:hypothetical protein